MIWDLVNRRRKISTLTGTLALETRHSPGGFLSPAILPLLLSAGWHILRRVHRPVQRRYHQGMKWASGALWQFS